MIYTPMTKKAISLMFEKHKDQLDKSLLPYVFHPFTVAESMTDEYSTTVALLHDVVEDTDLKIEDLRKMNYPNEVIDALELLTHDENTQYKDYIKKLARNDIARKVKISDLKHNMDLTRLNNVTEEDLKRLEKYKESLAYLENYIPNKENVYKDSFYGFIIGDALGVPVEFSDREKLENTPVVDMQGFGAHSVPDGTWSDDTSMMLAEMDSIKEKGQIDYYDMMDKFVQWMTESLYTATGKFFDIGITTRNALYNYIQGCNPIDCGGKGVNDNGNGALMRILPFVIYSYENKLNDEEEVKLLHDASCLTHGHEISQMGCKIYSDIMKNIFDGKSFDSAYSSILNKDYSKYYSLDTTNYYKRILDGSLLNLEKDEIKSSGFVVSTLEASLWSVDNSKSYEEAVLKAVNLGSDTDTVGAVTGSIAGACYGEVPDKWINKIRNKELADNIYDGFIETLKKNDVLEKDNGFKK